MNALLEPEQDARLDRLYQLLPPIYRMRDAEQGLPLQAFLRVIAEQANLLEDDIAQLYDNWFIETCEDWVVPYLGDLLGWQPVREAGEPGEINTPQGRARNKILIPRRELADTIRMRRRKGTLALLESLTETTAGWPARAVEFFQLLGWTQPLNHQRLQRGGTIDLRQGALLELIDTPFDRSAHSVNVRRLSSTHSQGRHNIPSVGLFVWRLRSYSVTKSAPYCLEKTGPHCFTFSVLGNDAPLFIRPERETDPAHIAEELNLPVPLRRRVLADPHLRHGKNQPVAAEALYGAGKSLMIWTGRNKASADDDAPYDADLDQAEPQIEWVPVPRQAVVVADLAGWQYQAKPGTVAIDPVLGRFAFSPNAFPKAGVKLSYHYGFSADLGGGEYRRSLLQPKEHRLYRVGQAGEFRSLNAALKQWGLDKPAHAVIEITDSAVYEEPLGIRLRTGQQLQLRAAQKQRPVLRLLDWQAARSDALLVKGKADSRFTLDGLLITGRSLQLEGDLAECTIRHCTLVPGWTLEPDCKPHRAAEPSLEIFAPRVRVSIEHSILGTIQIAPVTVPLSPDDSPVSDEELKQAKCQGISSGIRLNPLRLHISDSIVDATDTVSEAIGAPGCDFAHALLTIVRSTVIGQTQIHALELGENCIFDGAITVARRQLGCLRFSYVTPGSRTPRRYRCQPDLVEAAVDQSKSEAEREALKQFERTRVRPVFESVRYGSPRYVRLARTTAAEITRGADDQAEMGVFHDLYQPQRAANLHTRLDEFLPASLDAGVILAD